MIYIITHKIFDLPAVDPEHYQVLHVGTNKNCLPAYLRDDTGENISWKNPNYCELTGLYWIWKNIQQEPDHIVGIVHYRRYFISGKKNFLHHNAGKTPQILDYQDITHSLDHSDIILPYPVFTRRTVGQTYIYVHNQEDFLIMRGAVEKICPEYLADFDTIMRSHHHYYANMMICSQKLYQEYCSWLFSLMNEIEPQIRIEKYTDTYQKRVFGFMAERLLNVWVLHNKLKATHKSVYNTERHSSTLFTRISSIIHQNM